MGTLNLGSNGTINGVVTKPEHPYMVRQPNSNPTVNNNTFTKISTMFGTSHVLQGGMAFDASTGRITFPRVGLYRLNVKVNTETEGYYGNTVAAPVFKKVAKKIMNNIPIEIEINTNKIGVKYVKSTFKNCISLLL